MYSIIKKTAHINVCIEQIHQYSALTLFNRTSSHMFMNMDNVNLRGLCVYCGRPKTAIGKRM
jgi:hypothetical protein